SVILGFPYADVPEMGSGFIVVTDNDAVGAQKYADTLGDWLVENRELYRGDLISIEEAVARVPDSAKPVGLLDMGDNIGGGGTADSTFLAAALKASPLVNTTFVVLADPESVQEAVKAGVGNRTFLRMGGKNPDTTSKPIEAEVTVVSLHARHYRETQPRHGSKT